MISVTIPSASNVTNTHTTTTHVIPTRHQYASEGSKHGNNTSMHTSRNDKRHDTHITSVTKG